jgi:hypothetical protein
MFNVDRDAIVKRPPGRENIQIRDPYFLDCSEDFVGLLIPGDSSLAALNGEELVCFVRMFIHHLSIYFCTHTIDNLVSLCCRLTAMYIQILKKDTRCTLDSEC